MNYIDSVPIHDFYDEILFKFYGRKHISVDSGWEITIYWWDNKGYVTDFRRIV